MSNMEIALREIHALAYFYHWGREECWNTPCTERRVFYNKIEKQLKAENNGGSGSSGSTSKKSSYKESY